MVSSVEEPNPERTRKYPQAAGSSYPNMIDPGGSSLNSRRRTRIIKIARRTRRRLHLSVFGLSTDLIYQLFVTIFQDRVDFCIKQQLAEAGTKESDMIVPM